MRTFLVGLAAVVVVLVGVEQANATIKAEVTGRHVFYNNSYFDGNDPAANEFDDAAIATDKTALLPGETATFANYTGYSRGINVRIASHYRIGKQLHPRTLIPNRLGPTRPNLRRPRDWPPGRS